MSFTVAMTMPASTRTTMATCIQIHVGDIRRHSRVHHAVADVHVELSDRAQEILRQADAPAPADREVLDILQEAIDTVRHQLMAISDMLEQIAAHHQ